MQSVIQIQDDLEAHEQGCGCAQCGEDQLMSRTGSNPETGKDWA